MRDIIALSSLFLLTGIFCLAVCIKENTENPDLIDSNLLLFIMAVVMILYSGVFFILVTIRTIELNNQLKRSIIEEKKEEEDPLTITQRRLNMSKNYIF